jgi:tripartite-type tricarboxylate transporter receptor subunit TctC
MTGNSNRREFLKGIGYLSAGGILLPINEAFAARWPSQPITGVIGYRQGGGTDSTARTLIPALEEGTKGTINAINQPGAVASVATDFVWKKPADGHWWLFSSTYNKLLRCNGYHDTVPWKDWQFYGIDVSIMSWSVVPDSPIKSMGDLVNLAKKKPGKVTVSNSGVGGVWHLGNALLESATGTSFNNVAYKGGAGATLAAMQKEVDVVGSGIHEHIEHIKAGRLRNLAVFTPEPLKIEGTDDMQPVTNWVSALKNSAPYGGGGSMGLRRDTDPEILKTVEKAFLSATASKPFLDRMKKKVRFPKVRTGADADKEAALQELAASKILKELGIAKVGHSELGYPDPSEFEAWWPPKGYKPRI